MDNPNHGLSAAEILVLLDPQKSPAREVFKVALKELVALKHLKIAKLHQRVLLGSRDIKILEFGPSPTQAVLQSAYDSLRKAQAKPDTPLTTVLQTALRHWGPNYGKFKEQVVVPFLVDKGLVKSEVRKVLFITSKHLEATDEGRRVASRLHQDLARAQHLPQILRDDPQQATALYLSLGAAVLLSGAMWPHLEEINQQLRQQMASGDGIGTDTYLFDDDTNFGELDASISEFDSGFDAADGGGDSGSDGGGDGGGGGE